MSDTTFNNAGNDIAVIGMALRVPGANDLETFWDNLRHGVESITHFDRDDPALREGLDDPDLADNPNYVPAQGIIENVDMFDAALFGITPNDAINLDPQQRVLLECAWEALNHAGYGVEPPGQRTGVYVGVGRATYFYRYVMRQPGFTLDTLDINARVANEKDYVATRISYALNLSGPSYTVQAACATSLLAVQLGCRSLKAGECDLAVVGGCSIRMPQKQGYMYETGGILSPDGRCRAFDARAAGTIFSNGAGIVVLKRLADARRDADSVFAVIKGAAANNDGSSKSGFMTPSVNGQAQAVSAAIRQAAINADTIDFVEAHGTGTTVGDPIEIAALTRAFRETSTAVGACAIGSVKTNLGHLNTAAGVVSFIKAVLAVHNRMIPPSLHFESANPEIDFKTSPFFVNTECRNWPEKDTPRRAAVSAFGVGGTNVHVLIEQAPALIARPRHVAAGQNAASEHEDQETLFLLSARTRAALDTATVRLKEHVRRHTELATADVAWTLATGRKVFNCRRAMTCRRNDASPTDNDAYCVTWQATNTSKADRPRLVFLFPGQGAQYLKMAAGLYHLEPVFREQMDFCFGYLKKTHALDLQAIVYPYDTNDRETMQNVLNQPLHAQTALFAVEFALARLWEIWGVVPDAMLGHSAGEYATACIAGALTPEAALTHLVVRGRLMQEIADGAMVSVPAPVETVRRHLGDRLAIAAENSPSQLTVSGPSLDIARFIEILREKEGITSKRLRTPKAFHSNMVEPILQRYIDAMRNVPMTAPTIPYISSLTGTWITEHEWSRPDYWADLTRRTVRFADGAAVLLDSTPTHFIEVGPGRTMASLINLQPMCRRHHHVYASLVSNAAQTTDRTHLLQIAGRLWLHNITPHWTEILHKGRRVPLPGYPFERRQYTLPLPARTAAPAPAYATLRKHTDTDAWFYMPSWRRLSAVARAPLGSTDTGRTWLLLGDHNDVADHIRRQFMADGDDVFCVHRGPDYARVDDRTFALDPARTEHHKRLVADLTNSGKSPHGVISLSLTTNPPGDADGEAALDHVEYGFYGLLFLLQALIRNGAAVRHVTTVTRNVFDVVGNEPPQPAKAPIIGLMRVIRQEFSDIRGNHIDIGPSAGQPEDVVRMICDELRQPTANTIAIRGSYRWVESFEHITTPCAKQLPVPVREQGVYLITGGLGTIGMTIATWLVATFRARLILTGRTPLPPANEWPAWLDSHRADSLERRRIAWLSDLEAKGAEVMVAAVDVADEDAMQRLVDDATQRFGGLNGVIHAAGVLGSSASCSILDLDTVRCEAQFRAKIHGTHVLNRVLAGRALDFVVLASSLSAVLGGIGYTAYASANAFLDAFATYKRRTDKTRWMSVNWDQWQKPNSAADSAQTSLARFALTPAEGLHTVITALRHLSLGRLIVSTGDLPTRFSHWTESGNSTHSEGADSAHMTQTLIDHERPEMDSPYAPPTTATEHVVADMWAELFGFAKVGIHDDFFQLGGHSLLATRFLNKLRERVGVVLPIHSIFDAPSIAAISRRIDDQADNITAKSGTSMKAMVDTAQPNDRAAVITTCLHHMLNSDGDQGTNRDGSCATSAMITDAADAASVALDVRRELGFRIYAHQIRELKELSAIATYIASEMNRESGMPPHDRIPAWPASVGPEPVGTFVPVTQPLDKPIIFLLSAPRSGSTLLRAILSCHPALFSPGELGLLEVDNMGEWQRSPVCRSRKKGLTDVMTRLFGDEPATWRRWIDEAIHRFTPTLNIYRLIQHGIGDRVLVDKTPDYAMDLDVLQKSQEWFTDTRYIHLCRHPLAVIESFIRNRLTDHFFMADNDPGVIAEDCWTGCNDNILTLLEDIDQARSSRVHFEAMVENPGQELSVLCENLGISFDRKMLEPYAYGMFVSNHAGDQNFMTHRNIDPDAANGWRARVQTCAVRERCRRLASRLGYDV